MTYTRVAGIYQRGDKWYILPMSQATNGWWIKSEPILMIDADAPAPMKGEAALQALAASRHGVEATVRSPALEHLLRLAKVRSWRGFVRGTKSVDLCITNHNILVEPVENNGRGFVPIPDQEIELPLDASPEEIGCALERAMELAR